MSHSARRNLAGVEISLAERQALARELAAERGIKYKSALRSVQRYTTTAKQRRRPDEATARRILPPALVAKHADLGYVLIYEYDGEVDEDFKVFDAYANYRTREDAVASGEDALGRQDESFVLLLAEAHFRAPGTPYREYDRGKGGYEQHTTPDSGMWVLHLRWAVKSEPKQPKRQRKGK